MSRLIFLFGVFCALQNGLVQAQTTTTTEAGGIYFEYNPPPAKLDDDLFTARLEPTSGTNVTVKQFMYHLKHTIYASAFMTEIFTLGISTHLYTNDLMQNPSDDDHRIAIAVGKLWRTLGGMRPVNRLVLSISNETAHRYLKNEDRNGTFKFVFSKLNNTISADPSLNQTYADILRNLEETLPTLPPLIFVNINLAKFGSIDRSLIKDVWPDPKSFYLIAHARFSQHVESNLQDVNPVDYENVLLAHVLVDAASIPDVKETAQKAYEEAIADAVEIDYGFLRLTKHYIEFDIKLFRSLETAVFKYPLLEQKLAELKKNYPPVPVADGDTVRGG